MNIGPGEGRHRAREAALQMLYQAEVGRTEIREVTRTFWRAHDESFTDHQQAFANALAQGTAERLPEIDPLISTSAEHWRLERMAVIDRLILRLAVYEMLHRPDTPRTVVIDEALELAKTFSGDDAVKFVNGVLDNIRKNLEENHGGLEARRTHEGS
jgi:N utilization substance protein B